MKKMFVLMSAVAVGALMAHAAPVMAETTVTKQTISETPAGTTVVKTTTKTETVPVVPVVETTTSSKVVTKTTTTDLPPVTGSRVLVLGDFDLNRDGILSINEIGEMLFKIYDTDGNEVIDNIEYERKSVVTITPAATETVTIYDFNNDGIADETKYTRETFLRETRLADFDRNKDGLSPAEFAGKSFIETDIDNDRAIEMKEWQGIYNASINKKNEEDARLNK